MRGKLLGGRYRITRRIGEGGMAYVYLAKDEKLSRQVAIKILHKHMADNADIRRRFFQEAHAISALDHPNILKLYDFSGENSEELWMVMEVLQGLNLNEYVHTFPGNWLHPIIATMIVREILKALQVAHQEGLIHRDVKPENIFVLNGGKIKLMDFGIVKNTRSNSMTMTGTFMGSPSYMSPEQIRGKAIDRRSDIYSLGVLFYEIICGKLPYTGSSTHDVVMKICEGKFSEPRVHVPNLPDDLNKIISKAMSKHPMHRYQEANSFANDLEIFLANHAFEESHIELERYFADKHSFEDRLRHLTFTNKATLHGHQVDNASTHNKPVSKPPKTTRTRAPAELKQQTQDLGQQNQAALGRPKRKSQLAVPPPPPSVAQAPRRDHQVPTRNAPPRMSRKLAFTQNKFDLNPTVMEVAPTTVPLPANQHVPSAPRQQKPGHLQKQRTRPRQPKRRPKRHVIYYRKSASAPKTFWAAPFVGALLVGVVGVLSILGFQNLISRMPDKPARPRTTETIKPSISRQTVRPEKPVSISPRARQEVKTQGPAAQPRKSVRRRSIPETPATKTTTQPRSAQNSSRARLRQQEAAPVVGPQVTGEPVLIIDTERPPEDSRPAGEENPRGEPKEIVPAEARIKLSSRPAAEIYIDGKRLGTTIDRTLHSGWITLKPGRHRIELRRTGYKTYSTNLSFDAGERRSFPTVALEPDTNFTLNLSSNKQPVRVTLIGLSDRSRQQLTIRGSARSQVLPAGRYRLRFQYKGRTIDRTITLGGGQTNTSLNVDF